MTTPTSGVRTFHGGCQCRAVRFEADFDPSQGTGRCNCTICTRAGGWGVNVKPSSFRLISGKENLGDYSVSEAGHARFCKTCGIRVFGHGNVPEIGGEYVSVNVSCLDELDALTGTPIRYLDGRSDTWAPLREEVYRGPKQRG